MAKITYSMPAIAGDPDGYDAYDGKVTITQVSAITQELKIELAADAPAGASRLFATMGGMLGIIKNPSDPTAVVGEAMLKTWIGDITKNSSYERLEDDAGNINQNKFPAGTPRPGRMIYGNVDLNVFRNFLEAEIRNANYSDTVLIAIWNTNHTPPWSGAALTPAERITMTDNAVDVAKGGGLLIPAEGGTEFSVAAANPAGPGTMFTYRWLDTDRTSPNPLSPLPFFRALPAAANVPDIPPDVNEKWEEHPLITGTQNIPVPFDLYLRFLVYDESTRWYKPIAVNTEIQIWDGGTQVSTGTPLTTDAAGDVYFHVDDVATLNRPDLYFVAKTEGTAMPSPAAGTIPRDWSTRGWLAKDGSWGYYGSFEGTRLGTADEPLTFTVGLDYHLRFMYYNEDTYWDEVAPAGIPVEIWYSPSQPHVATTDAKGEVHGVFFGTPTTLMGGENVSIRIPMEIRDDAINMKRGRVADGYSGVISSYQTWVPPMLWVNNRSTRIGLYSFPEKFTAADSYANYFFVLKTYREWSHFLNLITSVTVDGVDHTWPGLETDIVLEKLPFFPLGSYSWPIGEVHIHYNSHWTRGIIFHELSHQIMWHYTPLGGPLDLLLDGYVPKHNESKRTNPLTALVEGWATFFEYLTESMTPRNIEHVYDSASDPGDIIGKLDPPPLDMGHGLEGALANSMTMIYQELVVGPAKATLSYVHHGVQQTDNGDLMNSPNSAGNHPWLLLNDVRERFVRYLWKPMKDLAGVSGPDQLKYIEKILGNNVNVKHSLLPFFYAYNQALPLQSSAGAALTAPPTLTGIGVKVPGGGVATPAHGVAGATVVLTGTNFSDRLRLDMYSYEEIDNVRTASVSLWNGLAVEFFDVANPIPANVVPAAAVTVTANDTAEVEVPPFPKTGQVGVRIWLHVRDKQIGAPSAVMTFTYD